MIRRRPSEVPFRGGLMLGLASLAVFLSGPAQTYGVSVFIDPILAEFGWSRSLISTLYSIATLAGAIPMILIGRQIDRVGNRLIMTIAAVLFGLSLLWLSVVSGPLLVLLGLAVLRTFGSGVLTLGARTLVPHWFVRRRGWAFSMLGISGSISLALVPRFNELLINWVGWRHAWQIIGAIVLLGLAPVLGLFIRNRPEDVGEKPDGHEVGKRLRRPSLLVDAEDDWTVREAMTTRMFWAMLLAGTVPAVVLTGISFHQTSLLTARGLSPGLAASVFAAESMVALPITLAAGWVVDRHPIRYTLAAAQVALLVALGALLAADTVALALIYGGLRGVFDRALGGLGRCRLDLLLRQEVPRLDPRRHLRRRNGRRGDRPGPARLGLRRDRLLQRRDHRLHAPAPDRPRRPHDRGHTPQGCGQ